MIELRRPYPVSVNRYWLSRVPKGWNRAIVHPSTEAKAYKAECGWIARAAGIRQPLQGPIRMQYVLIPKNGICMDLSNCMKVAEDALQGIAYVNDKQVRSIALEYGEPDGKGALLVRIEDLSTQAALAIDPPKRELLAFDA